MSVSGDAKIDEECPHGMGEPAWCVICNGRMEAEARQIRVRYAFRARESRYLSNARCDHFVQAGETILCLTDGCFVCKDCGEDFE